MTDAFWSLLEESDRRAFAAQAQSRRFARGRPLMHAGQVPEGVFLLQSGVVKAYDVTPEGRELLLAIRAPGDLVGELSALDERPRSASVVALEAVEALVLPLPAFRALLTARPAVAIVLIRVIGARLRDADARRIELGRLASLARVASCLLELCDRFGADADADGAVAIRVALTQEELAGWAGSSLESTARALRQLRELGWIETRRREIRVLDRAGLASAAG
jgi:CRP/FNR family transcriptional regulator, cyclic AMP receptor protein